MFQRSKKYQILKITFASLKRYNPDTLPKTNDHGVILLENEFSTKKTTSVSSTMFMKLTIKVVAFFLGHPV